MVLGGVAVLLEVTNAAAAAATAEREFMVYSFVFWEVTVFGFLYEYDVNTENIVDAFIFFCFDRSDWQQLMNSTVLKF